MATILRTQRDVARFVATVIFLFALFVAHLMDVLVLVTLIESWPATTVALFIFRETPPPTTCILVMGTTCTVTECVVVPKTCPLVTSAHTQRRSDRTIWDEMCFTIAFPEPLV
jgi:hypothetical protein